MSSSTSGSRGISFFSPGSLPWWGAGARGPHCLGRILAPQLVKLLTSLGVLICHLWVIAVPKSHGFHEESVNSFRQSAWNKVWQQ